jgi:hypothetical protein
MLEKQIEKKVADYAKTKGYLEEKFYPKYKKGFPDRLFMNPWGVTIYIEFKALNKKPSEIQDIVIKKLLKQNCLVFVVDNVDIGKKIIDECLNYKICYDNYIRQ